MLRGYNGFALLRCSESNDLSVGGSLFHWGFEEGSRGDQERTVEASTSGSANDFAGSVEDHGEPLGFDRLFELVGGKVKMDIKEANQAKEKVARISANSGSPSSARTHREKQALPI